MLRLTGRARHYDWGSATVIPTFLGVPPDGRPLAELWFGAHASAPALVADPVPVTVPVGALSPGDPTAAGVHGRPLDALVAAAPDAVLGPRVAEAFDAELPYLVKLLAADRPLSLQAHPTAAQAHAGRADELLRGVPETERRYADDRAKPETLVALAPMHALAGFRDPGEVADDLARIDVPALQEIVASLRSDATAAQRLEKAFRASLELPRAAVEVVLDALAELAGRGVVATHERWGSDSLAVARELLDVYPSDVGVLASVFLNPVDLAPGQALDVGAGVVHCYVHGFGLEVMASSDNVLRAGLTSKRVDVEALVGIVDFAPSAARVVEPEVSDSQRDPVSGDVVETRRYEVAAREYDLAVLDVATSEPVAVAGTEGPRVLLVLDGELVLTGAGEDAGDVKTARRGEALLACDAEQVTARGRGRLVVVSVP